MRKRVLTLFLVFSLLICPFYVYGENFDSAENTVSGEDLKNCESMQLLSALGILSFTENAPSFVTRQQFVEYVASMMKITKATDEKVFADTEDGSVAHTFAKLNILKVGDDKKFRPTDIQMPRG